MLRHLEKLEAKNGKQNPPIIRMAELREAAPVKFILMCDAIDAYLEKHAASFKTDQDLLNAIFNVPNVKELQSHFVFQSQKKKSSSVTLCNCWIDKKGGLNFSYSLGIKSAKSVFPMADNGQNIDVRLQLGKNGIESFTLNLFRAHTTNKAYAENPNKQREDTLDAIWLSRHLELQKHVDLTKLRQACFNSNKQLVDLPTALQKSQLSRVPRKVRHCLKPL